MTKYSYILVGDSRAKEHLQNEGQSDIKLGGLYQWANAFKQFGKGGCIEPFWRRDDLENYDIVHINLTPSNLQHISWIRESLGNSTSVKLICNVDIDLSFWSGSFAYYLKSMTREIEQADILFHVEPRGADVLSHLTGREVHECPHPIDVSRLYDYIEKEREPMIGTIFHRYTNESLTPYIAQKNIPLRRVLFGYNSKQPVVSNAGMYDQIMQYQDYRSHITEVAKSLIGCDLYSGFSYGRATIELAALGIPAIVSSTIGAAERLFPFTSVHPFNTRGAEKKLRMIFEDKEFAEKVISHAHKECTYYSLKNSHDRFIKMIESPEQPDA